MPSEGVGAFYQQVAIRQNEELHKAREVLMMALKQAEPGMTAAQLIGDAEKISPETIAAAKHPYPTIIPLAKLALNPEKIGELNEIAAEMDAERQALIDRHKKMSADVGRRLEGLKNTPHGQRTTLELEDDLEDAKKKPANDVQIKELEEALETSRIITRLETQSQSLNDATPILNPAVDPANKTVSDACDRAKVALNRDRGPAPYENMHKLAESRETNQKAFEALRTVADTRKDTPTGRTIDELLNDDKACDDAFAKLKDITDKMVTPGAAKSLEKEYKAALKAFDEASEKVAAQLTIAPKPSADFEFSSPLKSIATKVGEVATGAFDTLTSPIHSAARLSPTAEFLQRACREDGKEAEKALLAVTQHWQERERASIRMMNASGQPLTNKDTRQAIPELGDGLISGKWARGESRDQKTPNGFKLKVWDEMSKTYKIEKLKGTDGKPIKLNREQMKRAIALWNRENPDEQIPPIKEHWFNNKYTIATGDADLAKRFARDAMVRVANEAVPKAPVAVAHGAAVPVVPVAPAVAVSQKAAGDQDAAAASARRNQPHLGRS